MRSFDRSPALLRTTFSDIRAVNIQGSTTGAFTVNTSRIKTVMNACVCALHFRETGERIANWEIVFPNLFFRDDTSDEATTGWLQFLSLFRQIPFEVKTTSSP